MGEMAEKADEAGRQVDGSGALDHAVRFGMVVYGLVHLVFAWLALQLALGDHEEDASSTGALQELAQQPFGKVVLWLVVLGMALLVIWRLAEAAVGHRDESGSDLWRRRAVDVAKAAVYGVLGWSAVSVLRGSSSGSSDEGSQTLTARVLDLPGGRWIVGALGLAIVVVGAAVVWRGVTERFMKRIDAEGDSGRTSRAYRLVGKVGHVAKGLTIAVVGVLFVVSAVQFDPSESGGTDQALRTLLQQPFGAYLLIAMAAGIASFGLFCFAQARHLDR